MKKKLFLAYVAGLFDGEGSISIITQRKKDTHNETFVLAVTLCNMNFGILREIQKKLGIGRFYERKNTGKTPELKFNSRIAKRFLELILPYLYIKRKQAKLALKFQQRLIESNHCTLTSKEWYIRKSMRNQMLSLNARNSHLRAKQLHPYFLTKSGRPIMSN